MSQPVGVGGTNVYDDVVLVQSLLNAIPSSEGGPQTELDVDGTIGPLTIAAIRGYQQAQTHIVDGRVDVQGPTITSLVTTLNDRGALPSGLPNIGQPSDTIVKALTPGGVLPPLMSRAEWHPSFPAMKAKSGVPKITSGLATRNTKSFGLSWSYTGPTGWDFVTSSALDVASDIYGVTTINIVMKHDDQYRHEA